MHAIEISIRYSATDELYRCHSYLPCAGCVVNGELDGGHRICTFYVTLAPWQVAAFKVSESVACEMPHRVGWYEGGLQVQPAKGTISLECTVSPQPAAERELMDPWSGKRSLSEPQTCRPVAAQVRGLAHPAGRARRPGPPGARGPPHGRDQESLRPVRSWARGSRAKSKLHKGQDIKAPGQEQDCMPRSPTVGPS